MSLHRFVVEIDVDDDYLASRENGVGSSSGPLVPVDPSEWAWDDLSWVGGKWYCRRAEIVDYTAVAGEAVA